ncbi:Platelet binding protein GspB [Micromonospora saelicesensis]|nr:Platelet binding protein GspB [Micromonospora saelicesensis]
MPDSVRVSVVHDNPPSVPDFTQWPSFPFEGDLHVKQLDDPVPVEPPRKGEGLRECTACNAPDDAYIWVGERWRVRAMDRPTGLPMVLILESRTHLDLGDLPNLLAAELGVMTVRLERAIRSLDGVARVHVNRWGDGSAHLHMWFLARPYGRLQLRGTFLSLWDSILPPISEAQWRENLALVAAWLAEFGGRPLAEPPRIQWQAPSSLLAQSAAADAAAAAEAASAAAAGTEAVSVIEAAEEIPEPALDSTPDPTDADSGPRAEPVAGSTTTTVTDRAAEPARSATVSGPAAAPVRTASATNLPGIPTSGTRDSTAAALGSAASGSATTTASDGLHVGPAEIPTGGPHVVGPASGSADEAGSANPAASDLAAEGASGEAVNTTAPEKSAGTPGAAARTNGSDTPDVRATH